MDIRVICDWDGCYWLDLEHMGLFKLSRISGVTKLRGHKPIGPRIKLIVDGNSTEISSDDESALDALYAALKAVLIDPRPAMEGAGRATGRA